MDPLEKFDRILIKILKIIGVLFGLFILGFGLVLFGTTETFWNYAAVLPFPCPLCSRPDAGWLASTKISLFYPKNSAECELLDDLWDEFWDFRTQRESRRLYSKYQHLMNNWEKNHETPKAA